MIIFLMMLSKLLLIVGIIAGVFLLSLSIKYFKLDKTIEDNISNEAYRDYMKKNSQLDKMKDIFFVVMLISVIVGNISNSIANAFSKQYEEKHAKIHETYIQLIEEKK